MLFTDMRGSTATSVDLHPMLFGEQLGSYVGKIGDILRSNGAFVDKFIGDGVMGFWGYPGMPAPDPAVALAAARQILVASQQLRIGERSVRTGIGINIGDVFMGNVGSDEHRQFTIIGEPVNLAARFEGLTKELGADIVCARRLFEQLPDADRGGFERRFAIPVRGAAPQDVYILPSDKEIT
jgi:class 3 adenylate cyclase